MSKLVVFVDDSATVLMSAEMAFEEFIKADVINLVTYSNPLDCLQDIKNGLSYDLLVTDINMPQMNGLDLIHQIKQLPGCKAKPAIALTTESSQEMKDLGKKIGLNGWMTKPFTNDKLIASISKILRLS